MLNGEENPIASDPKFSELDDKLYIFQSLKNDLRLAIKVIRSLVADRKLNWFSRLTANQTASPIRFYSETTEYWRPLSSTNQRDLSAYRLTLLTSGRFSAML